MAGQQASGAVDFGYLEGFAAGDMGVVREVLTLFAQQAAGWAGSLDAADPGWRDVAHTIKGSARGVGANALGDACARAEAVGEGDLPALREALEAAVSDIQRYLARS